MLKISVHSMKRSEETGQPWRIPLDMEMLSERYPLFFIYASGLKYKIFIQLMKLCPNLKYFNELYKKSHSMLSKAFLKSSNSNKPSCLFIL